MQSKTVVMLENLGDFSAGHSSGVLPLCFDKMSSFFCFPLKTFKIIFRNSYYLCLHSSNHILLVSTFFKSHFYSSGNLLLRCIFKILCPPHKSSCLVCISYLMKQPFLIPRRLEMFCNSWSNINCGLFLR